VPGDASSGLAHELNQPLTSLCLYANAAQTLAEVSGSKHLTECLNRIGALSIRAGDIIRRIRAFVSHRSTSCTEQDTNVLIDDVLDLLEGELRKSGVQLVCDFHDELPPIEVDGIQIQQIVVNLVRNALEAMANIEPKSRTLTISTRSLRDELYVHITDTGPGIDPAIATNLYHPFHTTKDNGLGLGLAICRILIEAHRGRIECSSEPQGGTTFSFVLPYAVEKNAA